MPVKLMAITQIEFDELFGVSEAVGEVPVGAGGGKFLAEFALMESDGGFELAGFGKPEAGLPKLGVDGFRE